MLYPEVQRKAQAEIDRVVGSGRLPDFSDEESLPYISAVVREVLRYVITCYQIHFRLMQLLNQPRWRPVNPLGCSVQVLGGTIY